MKVPPRRLPPARLEALCRGASRLRGSDPFKSMTGVIRVYWPSSRHAARITSLNHAKSHRLRQCTVRLPCLICQRKLIQLCSNTAPCGHPADVPQPHRQTRNTGVNVGRRSGVNIPGRLTAAEAARTATGEDCAQYGPCETGAGKGSSSAHRTEVRLMRRADNSRGVADINYFVRRGMSPRRARAWRSTDRQALRRPIVPRHRGCHRITTPPNGSAFSPRR